jgi:glycosyltransferase involved in cell wall biosynthesis
MSGDEFAESDRSLRCRGTVLFLAPGDVSKGRVEPISWMRTCEAYARHGFDVTLATLRVRRPDAIADDEIWGHFGVDECFRIVTLPTRLDRDASVPAFRLWAGAAGVALAAESTAGALQARKHLSIVHARAPVLLAPFAVARHALPRSRRPLLVFETHALPKRINAWIVRSADLVVVNSEKLATEVKEMFELSGRRVLHAPLPPYNPVRPHPKMLARQDLGLEADAAVACYSGKMTQDNNQFLLAAASEVSQRVERFRMLLVGGNPAVLVWTRRRVSELRLDDVVILSGFVAPAQVELYQSAADVLVNRIPETMGTIPYATPAKLYEYQAIGRPIVATDFPLFDEVFGSNGDRAIQVVDRTPHGLADGIVAAFALPHEGTAMAERAVAFVRGRTWSTRTASILKALGV